MALRRSRTAPLPLEEYDRKHDGLTRARTDDDVGVSALRQRIGRPYEREDPFNLAGFFPPTSFAVERRWMEGDGCSSFSESDSDMDAPPTPEDNITTEGALPGKVMRWLVGLALVV